ncbi:hypothetical protein BX600DRAFT_441923 [Xylariales sp. PMI_506]|nr:hypothetical protein BX600DRAFT_441923 [Xylariales sp. PMI_506]
MGRIYSGAKNVVVWLGKAENDSDFAMDIFARKKSKLKRAVKGNNIKPSERFALLELCQRSYWSRVWVLQEIYLARTYVVRCGSKSISGTSIDDALDVFNYNRLDRWLQICITRDLQSTQPQDLIYAFLGISHDCQNGAIVPDYEKPLLDVYCDVVRFLMQPSHSVIPWPHTL